MGWCQPTAGENKIKHPSECAIHPNFIPQAPINIWVIIIMYKVIIFHHSLPWPMDDLSSSDGRCNPDLHFYDQELCKEQSLHKAASFDEQAQKIQQQAEFRQDTAMSVVSGRSILTHRHLANNNYLRAHILCCYLCTSHNNKTKIILLPCYLIKRW